MDGQSVKYFAVKTRHTNREPTNLLWVSECLSQAEGADYDGPALFPSVARVKEVWENTGGDVADLEESGSYEIVEVIVTVQRCYPD